jgi:hypothetical protein
MAKDGYNADDDRATWANDYTAEFAANLAIYDGLDANCGNQLLAGPMPVAGRYDTLASVLTDDQLWVNSDSGTCGVYLAVEADATGIIPNNDCGGRAPAYDVIDVTYSVLAVGAPSGVTDGDVTDDVDGDADPAAFPFLTGPN